MSDGSWSTILTRGRRRSNSQRESPALEEVVQLLTKEEIEKSSPRSLLPGTTISHYRIEEKIGAGGMGEVYRAHDPRLGRDVAIKILPEAFAADADRLQRFEQEARAAAALNHPNIVAIYDVGTWANATPYVVSELLEGETLRGCLQRGPLSVRRAMEVGAQIAQGLAAAHDKGMIHRDLKPENLWLTKDGHAKILDFGLAKLMPEGQPRAPPISCGPLYPDEADTEFCYIPGGRPVELSRPKVKTLLASFRKS